MTKAGRIAVKVCVLNGSPKGEKSVTLQYCRYMEKRLAGFDLTVHPVAQRIGQLERDSAAFTEVMADVAQADLVIWAFPLYYFLVCSQYKRFIELIFERNVQAAFQDRYTVALSTSVHFFDHTAHAYLHAICDDLQMHYLGSYSAAMYDLLNRTERQRLLQFGAHVLAAVQERRVTVPAYRPLVHAPFAYHLVPVQATVSTEGMRILILSDDGPEKTTLTAMIRSFQGRFSGPVEVANLRQILIAGGCLGCISCGYDNRCVYDGRDGFRPFFEEKVKGADALVFAGQLRDRYLSALWKRFFDRSFYNTHQPILTGKQCGFLLAGPLAQNPNLREILSAYLECMGANLAGIVTDEAGEGGLIDDQLQSLARDLVHFSVQGYRRPATFLGVGGMKVFRDEIWGPLRFAFLADHRYYRNHGLYRFPQGHYRERLRNLAMTLLLTLPPTRRAIRKRFVDEMVRPLLAVVRDK